MITTAALEIELHNAVIAPENIRRRWTDIEEEMAEIDLQSIILFSEMAIRDLQARQSVLNPSTAKVADGATGKFAQWPRQLEYSWPAA